MDDALRFLDILRKLSEHQVDFIIVGGVAAILEGAPISTFDLDVVYRRADDNNTRLAKALSEIDALYKDPAGREIAPDVGKLATINIHLLRTRLGALDVLSKIGDGLNYEELLPRSFQYEVAGLTLRVLNLETIIECKQIAGREKDLATLPMLRKTLELKRTEEA